MAICLLVSDVSPAHGIRTQTITQEGMPNACDVPSAVILPRFRDCERVTTAALAAFGGSRVGRQIEGPEQALRQIGMRGSLRVMALNGGVATLLRGKTSRG